VAPAALLRVTKGLATEAVPPVVSGALPLAVGVLGELASGLVGGTVAGSAAAAAAAVVPGSELSSSRTARPGPTPALVDPGAMEGEGPGEPTAAAELCSGPGIVSSSNDDAEDGDDGGGDDSIIVTSGCATVCSSSSSSSRSCS
ncbi:unnamed protein product, partial [Ectocarpus sp. 8 AP-2014]